MLDASTSDFWALIIMSEANSKENKVEWHIDSVYNCTEDMPTHKNNLFNVIGNGKLDWSKLNHVINSMKLRVRFIELCEWFEADPWHNFKLIESKAEKVG